MVERRTAVSATSTRAALAFRRHPPPVGFAMRGDQLKKDPPEMTIPDETCAASRTDSTVSGPRRFLRFGERDRLGGPPRIAVIDAIMGAGKTELAIRSINNSPFTEGGCSRTFLFVTPYLAEVQRVKEECSWLRFREPTDLPGLSKSAHLEMLLKEGCNVVTTHALFARLSDVAVAAASEQGYDLIIDEALECYAIHTGLKARELDYLVKSGSVEIDLETQQIKWIWNRNEIDDGHRFEEERRLAKSGSLFQMGPTTFVREFPRRILDAFSSVNVLTYLFAASTMAPYLNVNRYEVDLLGIEAKSGRIVRRGLADERSVKAEVRRRLVVYEGPRNDVGAFRNRIGRKRGSQKLTKTHLCRRSSAEEERAIRNATRHFIRREANASADTVGWTTFKACREGLTPEGCKSDSCFIALNARASNQWKDKRAMVYLANRYQNPALVQWIEMRGGEFNPDLFALSELLQWLWRGCIRDPKAGDMHVFIPSERMRTLLLSWTEAASQNDLLTALQGDREPEKLIYPRQAA